MQTEAELRSRALPVSQIPLQSDEHAADPMAVSEQARTAVMQVMQACEMGHAFEQL